MTNSVTIRVIKVIMIVRVIIVIRLIMTGRVTTETEIVPIEAVSAPIKSGDSY